MTSIPWRRIGAVVLLILSFIALPFWVTLVLTVFFLYVFDYFAEGVIIFFLADISYAVPLERFYGFEYTLTAIALLLFLLSLIIKPYLLR
jgi:uncharacterized membrane protein